MQTPDRRLVTEAALETTEAALVDAIGDAADETYRAAETRAGELVSAAAVNTTFTVRYTGGAWEYPTLAAAKAAGLDERQTVWFIGNPSGSMPAWARTGDVWTRG